MLTAQQRAEIIQAHWKLLWPLPTQERMRVLDELIADYEFEEAQSCVTEIFSAKPIFISDLPPALSAAL